MARIRRRRADDLPQAPLPQDASGTVAPPAPTPDGDGESTAELPVAADQPTTVTASADAPAGADPAEAARPDFRERGRMRRRLRYLRRLRELGFRDIGGLVFDLDRFGRDRADLVRAKLDALRAVDDELRTLETALDDVRPLHELREPGIAACPRCGGLHGTEARYCPSCGLHLSGPRTVGEVAGPALAPAAPPAAEEPETPAVESASGATSELAAAAPNGSGPTHAPETEPAVESESAGNPAQ